MKKNQQATAERELFRTFYRGNKLLWTAVMALSILSSLGGLVISWLLKEAVDVIYTRDVAWLFTLVKIGGVTMAALAGLDLLRYRLRVVFLQRAVRQYKSHAFARLSRKSISAFTKENTSRYISVLTNDIAVIENQYLAATFNLVYWILMAVGSGTMLFWYGGPLAWVCIGFSVVPIVLSVLMGGEMTKRTTAVSDQNEHFVAQVKDLLNGFAVLKSFQAEGKAGKLFDRANFESERMKLRANWWSFLLAVMQETCSMLLQFGVVFAGGYLAIRGEMTAGTAVVMINLCGQMVNPLAVIPQTLASRKAARGLVTKLGSILRENETHSGESIEPVLREVIRLERVSFGYEPGKDILHSMDLRLETGKKYAIVGASGSGKSTLLNLLMGGCGGYSGSVTIDGRELSGVAPESLYNLMSLIGQNVFVFDNTIWENITMFRDFPEEAVASAAEQAGLTAVIEAKGADYRCGENGVGLSGGERQRISIARSLLRGTPVLMMDEATAALDNQTAFEVTDAILKLEGLTRIVVTHRLEEKLLEQYDKIFVLRDGRIAEQGTFRDLMARRRYFYSLYHVANG